jgi:hypothetical protein
LFFLLFIKRRKCSSFFFFFFSMYKRDYHNNKTGSAFFPIGCLINSLCYMCSSSWSSLLLAVPVFSVQNEENK